MADYAQKLIAGNPLLAQRITVSALNTSLVAYIVRCLSFGGHRHVGYQGQS